VIAEATAGLFRGLSRVRGRRIFHPHGIGFDATLVPAPDAPRTVSVLAEGERRAIVRLSRAVGLPEALPDPCGLALRVPGAYGEGHHQDLLLVTSLGAPGGRHLIAPAPGFLDTPYSSLLPYRVNGRLALFGAQALTDERRLTLAELRERRFADLVFELLLAGLTGEWRAVARIELGERLDPEAVENLRFDPMNSGGGLVPAGVLNRLRRPAYRGSQEGRGATEEDSPLPAAPSAV
jgi:hypothetical protein